MTFLFVFNKNFTLLLTEPYLKNRISLLFLHFLISLT